MRKGMTKFSADEVRHLVQIARDARSGSTFLERMDSIASGLKKVVPFTNLATMMVNDRTHEAPPETHVYHASKGSADLYIQYGTHYSKLDPVYPWGVENKGVPTLLSHHVTDKEYGRTEYSTGFLKAGDIRHILGVNLPMPDGWTMIYSVQRSKECPDFTARDLEVAAIVLPDIQRAAFGTLLQERLGETVPSGSGTGAVIFTKQGDIVKIDERAKTLLKDLLVEGLPTDELLVPLRALADAPDSRWALESNHRLCSGGWIRLTFARASDCEGNVVALVRRLSPGEETFEAEAK